MSILLLALALAAPTVSVAGAARSSEPLTCAVGVEAPDREGRARPVRLVSASVDPAVVFRGRVRPEDRGAPPLVFDVFNPRGQRYQVLLARPRTVWAGRGGPRPGVAVRTHEAAMAVSGSAIAWTSMYGRWRVEPRIEGTREPCGEPQFFTILP
jgi:hypothetical protein